MALLPWTTSDIVSATGGEFCFGDPERRFFGIAIDSRRISPGELFVAIKGEVHDGHGFADAVVQAGTGGVLVDKQLAGTLPMERWEKQQVTCVTVDDTTRALGDLGRYNRHRAGIPVVAITGSNGKTTTREMTAGVSSRRFRTLTPMGNFNNEIGMPLTLLSLQDDHELAVLELGMNHPGEIRRLGHLCHPDIGVITNIGPAHLEGVGSIEGVAKAKAELLETINPDGTVVLNADDPRVARLAGATANRIVDFGLSEKAAVRGLDVKADGKTASFTLSFPGGSVPIRLKVPGRFMVSNALAAAAVGHCLGQTAEEIRAGLESFDPVRGRMNICSPGNGLHLIDDTYNANPESMAAAIDALQSLRGRSRGIMVAGDMLELGRHAASLHRDVGVKAAGSGIARLYVTGEFARSVAAGAENQGMDSKSIILGTKEDIIENLISRLRPDDWVLVKGSRGMRMEQIVDGIKQWATGDNT